jgi:hypothetical protein
MGINAASEESAACRSRWLHDYMRLKTTRSQIVSFRCDSQNFHTLSDVPVVRQTRLCFEHVDNSGGYSIPFGDRPSPI